MSQKQTDTPAPTTPQAKAPDSLAGTASQVLDLAQRDPRRAEAIWHGLSPEERGRAILSVGPEERERLITLARDSAQLVQALAPDEFAATVLELGDDQAAGMLALSSDDQLRFLLDLTGWVDEVFAPTRYEAWLPLMLEAGVGRLTRWLESTDLEVLALLTAHWVRVEKWLPSQDEQEPPDTLPSFTLDGVYFLEFRRQESAGFVAQVLTLMKSEQPQLYSQVLEAMLHEPASLLAEDSLRWRNGRLADHGIPDRVEALELWAAAPPGEERWEGLGKKADLGFMAGAPPRSDRALDLLPPDTLLPALAGHLDPATREVLRAELAYIANCGVIATGADPASPSEAAKAARESLGLVNLGLGLLSGGDDARAARIVERLSLAALARQGSQALRKLNHRAYLLIHEGWLQGVPGGLHFLGPPLDRWLAGLLYPRPRCYDPALAGGREYRSFLSQEDLELADRQMTKAEFWGRLLLELMGMTKEDLIGLCIGGAWPEDPTEVKAAMVVGTWLADRALGLEGLAPVPLARLGEAVAALQAGLQGPLGQEALDSAAALEDPAAAALAGEILRDVLGELSLDLGRINLEQPLDPHFVGGLVIGE